MPDGEKSSLLQQAKRWVSNKWVDWQGFYWPFARYFLAGLAAKGEIVLVIDGSQTGQATTTLILSVFCRGSAVPVACRQKGALPGRNAPRLAQDDRTNYSP